LARIRDGLDNLGTVAAEIAGTATAATSAVAEQSSAVAETAATIEELAVSAAAIADNSSSVAAAAQQTAETMEELHETVQSIAARSRELEEGSQQIDRILSLIEELAGQTSLLSLNAAIEAARSGASGKGFAVVAEEVRKLAERSRESSDAIRSVIRTIRDETDGTKRAAEEGRLEAHRVTELMTETAEMLEQSILATRQQQSAAEQVAAAVAQIRTSSEQLVADSSAEGVDAVVEAIAALEAAVDGMVGNRSSQRRSTRPTARALDAVPQTTS
jgi:methyl-accepting chemotaxis protein